MADITKASLEKIAGGKAPVLFAHLLQQVADNIRDPNTDGKKARKITLTFTFAPSKNRQESSCRLSGSVKLADVEEFEGAVFLRRMKDGTVEVTTHDTRQEDLFPGTNPDDGVSIVDARTGEILED